MYVGTFEKVETLNGIETGHEFGYLSISLSSPEGVFSPFAKEKDLIKYILELMTLPISFNLKMIESCSLPRLTRSLLGTLPSDRIIARSLEDSRFDKIPAEALVSAMKNGKVTVTLKMN